jgi:hypothetical protein
VRPSSHVCRLLSVLVRSPPLRPHRCREASQHTSSFSTFRMDVDLEKEHGSNGLLAKERCATAGGVVEGEETAAWRCVMGVIGANPQQQHTHKARLAACGSASLRGSCFASCLKLPFLASSLELPPSRRTPAAPGRNLWLCRLCATLAEDHDDLPLIPRFAHDHRGRSEPSQ